MPGPRWAEPDAAEAGSDALPELPALTRLLRRSKRVADVPDWRSGLLAALGSTSQPPPVAIAARALPSLPTGASLCFASPLHVVAGISRVHLPPGGRLHPEAEEDAAWRAAFNEFFAGEGLQLHAVTPGGHWLLQAECAASARDADPAELIGEALARPVAADPTERALRRLGAEVEMWLATHPLNRTREARRQPPVNALWFWSGGRAVALPLWSQPARLLSAAPPDAWLAGLAAHLSCAVEVVSEWQQVASTQARRSDDVVVAVLTPDAGGASGQYWQMLEQEWFAPVAQAMEAGRIGDLQLVIGRSDWRAPERSWLRWWPRRRLTWWQATGSVA